MGQFQLRHGEIHLAVDGFGGQIHRRGIRRRRTRVGGSRAIIVVRGVRELRRRSRGRQSSRSWRRARRVRCGRCAGRRWPYESRIDFGRGLSCHHRIAVAIAGVVGIGILLHPLAHILPRRIPSGSRSPDSSPLGVHRVGSGRDRRDGTTTIRSIGGRRRLSRGGCATPRATSRRHANVARDAVVVPVSRRIVGGGVGGRTGHEGVDSRLGIVGILSIGILTCDGMIRLLLMLLLLILWLLLLLHWKSQTLATDASAAAETISLSQSVPTTTTTTTEIGKDAANIAHTIADIAVTPSAPSAVASRSALLVRQRQSLRSIGGATDRGSRSRSFGRLGWVLVELSSRSRRSAGVGIGGGGVTGVVVGVDIGMSIAGGRLHPLAIIPGWSESLYGSHGRSLGTLTCVIM
mmetsp:Transcript_23254/g.50242  ORF Transcript_23254/g.50242 Transcript_23254/m.50242 type:complete len:406 (+) Transcript_23254:1061-2278(+)